MKAKITEVFSSIQGEGPFLGERQVFVRFKACNMKCAWCDVPPDLPAKEYEADELMDEVNRLEASHGPHHSVSLTGGEPLVYIDFLKELLKRLKQARYKVYLETNGTLPEGLSKVIDDVDIVAMDIKLPSSTLDKSFWKEHEEFLKIASKKDVFVKAVVSGTTTEEDIERAIGLVTAQDRTIPFIIQPADAAGGAEESVRGERLARFLGMAEEDGLDNAAIIPQVNKILGVR